MTDSTIPYKDHVESEFGHVYKELQNITTVLGTIETKLDNTYQQALTTNNRVTHLEEDKTLYLKTRVDKRDFDDKCRELESVDKKISDLSIELEPVKTVIKYKKQALVLLVFAVAAVLVGAWGSVETFFQKQRSKETNTELIEYKREVQTYQNQVMEKLNQLDVKLNK